MCGGVDGHAGKWDERDKNRWSASHAEGPLAGIKPCPHFKFWRGNDFMKQITVEEFNKNIKPDALGHRWGCFCPTTCIDCGEIKYFYDQIPQQFRVKCNQTK